MSPKFPPKKRNADLTNSEGKKNYYLRGQGSVKKKSLLRNSLDVVSTMFSDYKPWIRTDSGNFVSPNFRNKRQVKKQSGNANEFTSEGEKIVEEDSLSLKETNANLESRL